jgi:S1-C subfamily serine protease
MSNLAHVYKKIKPAVVAIGITVEVGKQTNLVIAGTGFCIHPRGIIVTCRHVFEDFEKQFVPKFKEQLDEMFARPGEIFHSDVLPIQALFFLEEANQWVMVPARISDVIGDREIDIAVLRTDAQNFRKKGQPYPSMKMGDSNTLKEDG